MKKLLWAVALLMAVAAIALAAYPFISDYVNSANVEGEGVVYNENVQKLDAEDFEALLNAAREYNKSLVGNYENSDPFATVYRYPDDYMKMLRVNGTDVMATIRIPKINVNLPIYHGSNDDVLKKGVGHLSSSSLPVGGKATHCILTGHTGQSNLRLFSDVDRLEAGDVFYITVLNETLAYRVYDIEVVLPEETQNLQIDPDEDYVTLVTCTPFGINTHRLLVHARRISLDEAESTPQSTDSGSTWDEEYRKAILWGAALLAAILAVFFTVRFIVRRVKKHRNNNQKTSDDI